ncbi:MAG TPA: adenylate/guanylate cyclase domain-containing protein, partial [Herpetosiphonaceae bacterium]
MPQLVDHLRRYLPALFANQMAALSPPASPLGEGPASAEFAGAVLFADISGFTPLAERLAAHGEEGVELLTEALNRCFGPLIDTIEAHGGDILRFAGDALLALWPSGSRSLGEAARRAAQCGLALQALPRVLAEGGELRMRISIGAGAVTAMQLGGVNGRWELLLSGDPLPQMTEAEHAALPGEVALSSAAWALIEPWAVAEDIALGIVRLTALREELPPRPLTHLPLPEAAAPILQAFLPRAIVSRLAAGQDRWGAELRRVTTLFIQLEPAPGATTPRGGDELARLQQLVAALQRQIYDYDGSINQLLIDDKGLVALAAFGLPPRMHEDDALRALRAAQAIETELRQLGAGCAIGIATGKIYCGVRGNERRSEYAMIGDTVNLAARLMQLAGPPGGSGPGLLCEAQTARAARHHLLFDALPPASVKG